MAALGLPTLSLESIPLATRVICSVVVAFTVLDWVLTKYTTQLAVLELYAGLVLWRPWTLVTSSLVEGGVLELLLSLLILLPSLAYIEKLWGAVEIAKFAVVTCVVSNVIAVIVNVLEHFVIGMDGFFLFGQSYHGMTALQTGMLVALTQAIPEHQILIMGTLGVRMKRIPMIYVTISTVLCLLGFQSPWILIQFGWLVSWVYLRFYRQTGGDLLGGGPVTWGDRSEAFAFVHWFPPFLHKPISILSDVVYKLAVRVRLVKSYAEYDSLSTNDGSGSYASLPGGARAEAERRRALALKALDQRTASLNAGSSSGTPATLHPSAAAGAAAAARAASPAPSNTATNGDADTK